MRGETTSVKPSSRAEEISIHSPHAGRDLVTSPGERTITVISIHSPHAGRDMFVFWLLVKMEKFQSTLPMRGETGRVRGANEKEANFNPLSPCGERLPLPRPIIINIVISIHSPHAGRDSRTKLRIAPFARFQSTLPMRGETFSRASLISA